MARQGDLDPVQKNRRRLIDCTYSALDAEGFSDKKGVTAWRRTNRKIDVMKVEFVGAPVCRKWHVPVGSFSLKPGCFFPFIPSINAEPVGQDQSTILRPNEGLCQIRLLVFKSLQQRECAPPNIWWVGTETDEVDKVIADVWLQTREKALPFYSRFEDIEELLRAVGHRFAGVVALSREGGRTLLEGSGRHSFLHRTRIRTRKTSSEDPKHIKVAVECRPPYGRVI